jgi:hypothetical protein
MITGTDPNQWISDNNKQEFWWNRWKNAESNPAGRWNLGYAEDITQDDLFGENGKRQYPFVKSGDDWVRWQDNPGFNGLDRNRKLPASRFARVFDAVAVKVETTGTDNHTIMADF